MFYKLKEQQKFIESLISFLVTQSLLRKDWRYSTRCTEQTDGEAHANLALGCRPIDFKRKIFPGIESSFSVSTTYMTSLLL